MARRLLVLHLALLATLALLPLGSGGRDDAPRVAAVPFATIFGALGRGLTTGTIVSIAGNVAAFVPVGLLAPAAVARCHSWRRVLGLGLVISLAIEAAQLTISVAVGHEYRRADVDDLLLNVAGAAAGFVLWRIAGCHTHRWAVQRCRGVTIPPPSDGHMHPAALPAHRSTARRRDGAGGAP